MLHTPDLTSPDMTGYTLDYTAGAWSHQISLLFPCTYSHTWVFPSVRVVLSVTFVHGFVMLVEHLTVTFLQEHFFFKAILFLTFWQDFSLENTGEIFLNDHSKTSFLARLREEGELL